MKELEKYMERLKDSEEIFTVEFPVAFKDGIENNMTMKLYRDRKEEYFLCLEVYKEASSKENEPEPDLISFRSLNSEEKAQMRKILWFARPSKEWASYETKKN